MNDTTISMRGYVGGDVVLRDAGDTQVAEFRLGVTPRVYHRATDSWVDGVTQWYTVNAWRKLGLNVKQSLHKGEPVVVTGRLTISEWADKDGVLRQTMQIDADHVGHDLLRGTSMFVRPPLAERESTAQTETEGVPVPEWALEGTAA